MCFLIVSDITNPLSQNHINEWWVCSPSDQDTSKSLMAFLVTALMAKLQHGFGGNKPQSTYRGWELKVDIDVLLLKLVAKSPTITLMAVEPACQDYQLSPDVCMPLEVRRSTSLVPLLKAQHSFLFHLFFLSQPPVILWNTMLKNCRLPIGLTNRLSLCYCLVQ